MADDYYAILGIERGASEDEIKRAYRKKAHQYHPDKAEGDEAMFKKVNEAYQVLSNSQKRQQYDQFGQTFEQGSFGGGGGGVDFDDIQGFQDIFAQMFGGSRGGGRRAERRGEDVAVDVSITFVESATGTTEKISPRMYHACSHCRGNGAEPGTPIRTCNRCDGSGAISQQRQTMFGVFQQTSVCPECRGEGKQPEKVCHECRGAGRTLQERRLEVDIPGGIEDGQQIRLPGQGPVPERGGQRGDMYVTVRVQPHKALSRRGSDVIYEQEVSFVDAILGTRVSVPTIFGERTLDIPSGTQPGQTFTFADEGFPSLRGREKGDQVVSIRVRLPKKLNRKQRKLLKEFRDAKGVFA